MGARWSCARGCAERQAGGCLGAGSGWLRSKVEARVRVSIVEVEVRVEVKVEVEAEIGEVRRCGTTKVRDRIELRQESAGEGEMGSGMGIEWDGGMDGWYGMGRLVSGIQTVKARKAHWGEPFEAKQKKPGRPRSSRGRGQGRTRAG